MTRASITEFNRNNGATCDDCGTEMQDNCLVCGAPQCCPKCCAEATAEIVQMLAKINKEKEIKVIEE